MNLTFEIKYIISFLMDSIKSFINAKINYKIK